MQIRAKHRRRFHFTVFLLAFIPGGIVTYLFPSALPWITFMSWVAFWYAPVSAWAAETPVEEEE